MIKKIIKAFKNPYIILLRLDQKRIITLSDEKFLKYRGLDRGFNFDLKNPKTYSEKLQWLKLHDRNPLYTNLVDKYEVKKYVSEILGEEYVIPTIGIYNSFDEIDFTKLPNEFVIKCTHDSASTIICKDKEKFNILECKRKLNKALSKNYYYGGREWPYKNVKPRILIEKYMEDAKTQELRDYKYFCFDGKVKLMFIATNRQGVGDTYFDFFDDDLKHLPFTQGHPNAPKIPDIPINHSKMVELAEKISHGLPHVRVDFYEVNGKIYFGEMTFYHFSGFTHFNPEEWDQKFGELIDLKKVKSYEK